MEDRRFADHPFYYHEKVLPLGLQALFNCKDDAALHALILDLAGRLTAENFDVVGKQLLGALALHDNLLGGRTVIMIGDIVNF
jgi:hypothetical protein